MMSAALIVLVIGVVVVVLMHPVANPMEADDPAADPLPDTPPRSQSDIDNGVAPTADIPREAGRRSGNKRARIRDVLEALRDSPEALDHANNQSSESMSLDSRITAYIRLVRPSKSTSSRGASSETDSRQSGKVGRPNDAAARQTTDSAASGAPRRAASATDKKPRPVNGTDTKPGPAKSDKKPRPVNRTDTKPDPAK